MISINLKKRFFTSIFLFFLLFLIFNYKFILIFTLLLLGMASVLEFFNMSKKIFKSSNFIFLSNIFFTVYIFLFCTFFFYFSSFIKIKIVLFIILLGCIFSDIGGYIFGKIFKGQKLTKISPNKTISGALGSIFSCCLVISFLNYYLTGNLNFNLIIIGIIISVFCQLGDIFFSLLKRKSKIKDTGKFLPGHGGILDRLDGILIALPAGFITLILFY